MGPAKRSQTILLFFLFSFLISIFQTLIKVRISNASAVFSFLLPNHVSELEFLFMAASSYIHEEF